MESKHGKEWMEKKIDWVEAVYALTISTMWNMRSSSLMHGIQDGSTRRCVGRISGGRITPYTRNMDNIPSQLHIFMHTLCGLNLQKTEIEMSYTFVENQIRKPFPASLDKLQSSTSYDQSSVSVRPPFLRY